MLWCGRAQSALNERDAELCFLPDSSLRCTVSEVELSRAPDASATAVRTDDSGAHALVSIKAGNTLGSTAEHLYINSKWKKAKPIPKLKGLNITAAAWNAEAASEASSGCVWRTLISNWLRVSAAFAEP